ncbi:MAG: thiamine diphosphokinase [Prevotellaceae bacterium]|nr:thiamine diphosphokinase [Prevotellaceae bacterium]
METTYDCVILANGDYPTHPIPLSILHSATYICCCDGAAQTLIEHGIMPNAIIGDGDSLSPDFKERYADLIHIIEEQEYNDLTKATRFALSRLRANRHSLSTSTGKQEAEKICYLGCTGRREDHTLGNIALLSYYLREFHIQPTMYTDHGFFTPSRGDRTFSSFPHQQVSIFNLNCAKLSSENLKWQAYPAKEMWQGTLNEVIADTFTIYADREYLIFQTYEPKDM